MPTQKYRASFCVPKELEDRIFNLRKLDEFKRCSISEIIRILVEESLDRHDADDTASA